MTITCTWATRVINVPQADLTPVGGSFYELDLEVFRNALHALQESEQGIMFPRMFVRVAPVTFAGITKPQVVTIINGYTITFEDAQYVATIVGGDNNLSDVTNQNQVSVRQILSTGSIQTVTNLNAIAGAVWNAPAANHTDVGSFGASVAGIWSQVKNNFASIWAK